MKKIIFLLLCICIFVIVTYLVAEAAASFEKFYVKKYGFYMEYPSDWKREPLKQNYIFKATIGWGNERKVIIVTIDREKTISSDKLDSYYNSVLNDIKAMDKIPSFTYLDSGKTNIGGKRAVWGRFLQKVFNQWAVEEDRFILQNNYIFTIKTRVAGATREVALNEFQRYQPLFQRIIKTIKF